MNQIDDKITCQVFSTNLQTPEEVEDISITLNGLKGIVDWSVDLEDWEKVLRVEGTGIQAREIKSRLRSHNVLIREMPI